MTYFRLCLILCFSYSLTLSPVVQGSVFGALAKIFKSSDEAAQVAGKSDEVAAAAHVADDIPLVTKEVTEATDDIPLVTKEELVETTDDISLVTKEEQIQSAEDVPLANKPEPTISEQDGNMIVEIAKEAISQTAGAVTNVEEQESEEETVSTNEL